VQCLRQEKYAIMLSKAELIAANRACSCLVCVLARKQTALAIALQVVLLILSQHRNTPCCPAQAVP